MSDARCLGLACLYALPITLLVAIIGACAGEQITGAALTSLAALTCGAVYLLLRVALLGVWNRRAAQLVATVQRRR